MIRKNDEVKETHVELSSFRDPCGFLFWQSDRLYRQINPAGARDYDLLMTGGLYAELVGKGRLIPHAEDEIAKSPDGRAYRIVRPEMIPYISYPYEWCFEQYRDAALLTLDIALCALDKGMILKDAASYNVQFRGGSPVFIDTLSFTRYREGQTWDAYGQFCRHFLAPLLLMSGVSPSCAKMTVLYIDGIPLELASAIMGGKWKWRPSVYLHLYLHARQVVGASSGKKIKKIAIPLISLKTIIANLRKLIAKLKSPRGDTEWAAYYDTMLNYSDEVFKYKGVLVARFLDTCDAKSVCDIGANRGEFSKYAAERTGGHVVAYDVDHTAVNQHYLYVRANKKANVLPLVIDLTNPSPAIGWANEERKPLEKRANFDCIMALALIHHLAISNNVPLEKVAENFSRLGRHLIIEFVPKEDSQMKKLLLNREDIFENYNEAGFESAFARYFELVKKEPITGSTRILYLYKTNSMKEKKCVHD